MNRMPLTHDELQQLEHANKILREHLELVQLVTNQSESMLNTYLPILHGYLGSVRDMQKGFSDAVTDILKSSRELGTTTGRTQQLQDFIAATLKLHETLTSERVEQLRRVFG